MAKRTITKLNRMYEMKGGRRVRREKVLPPQRFKVNLKGEANAYIIVGSSNEAINILRRIKNGSVYEDKV